LYVRILNRLGVTERAVRRYVEILRDADIPVEMYAGEWLAQIPLDFLVEGGDELRAAVLALAARLNASALATEPKPTIP
jgi:hypothetical protein